MSEEQLAFDIEGLIHQAAIEAAPEWRGAPLHFTTAYHSPSDLDAAYEHWQFLHKRDKPRGQSRVWHRSMTVPGSTNAGEHVFDLFRADLDCRRWLHPEPHGQCLCVGGVPCLVICEPHRWFRIAGDENTAVEGWHDHAFPGWRGLPIVPARLRDTGSAGASKAVRRWIEENYPPAMQVAGAPIITERARYGTRHVPGRSPWGGYDLSHTAVESDRALEPRGQSTSDVALAPTRPAPAAYGLGVGD